MKKRIVFIEFGAQEKFVNQIKYSVMTLKAFNALEKSEIVIYSEDPSKYKNLDVSSRSIKEKVSEYSLKRFKATGTMATGLLLLRMIEFTQV